MVKNTKGGNKHKKHKKQTEDFYEREVPFATDGLQYALVTKILDQSFNSKDYYRYDTNNNNNISISDVFLIFYKISGGIINWPDGTPYYRIFNETEWSYINPSNTNFRAIYPGSQSMTISNLVNDATTRLYLVRTGYRF